MSTRHLRGVTHLGERLVLVLDVSELLRANDAPALLPTETLPALAEPSRV
jgi:chemotaxis signal transduction protein